MTGNAASLLFRASVLKAAVGEKRVLIDQPQQ